MHVRCLPDIRARWSPPSTRGSATSVSWNNSAVYDDVAALHTPHPNKGAADRPSARGRATRVSNAVMGKVCHRLDPVQPLAETCRSGRVGRAGAAAEPTQPGGRAARAGRVGRSSHHKAVHVGTQLDRRVSDTADTTGRRSATPSATAPARRWGCRTSTRRGQSWRHCFRSDSSSEQPAPGSAHGRPLPHWSSPRAGRGTSRRRVSQRRRAHCLATLGSARALHCRG